ncbi:hypothetical protein PPN31114_03979 [Pandoraea pneumonica]|uniref:AlpA family phage regulatory protein n=1 Tax=Pandoraea pneumonica TaxID=2508299 RepID=A0A5E4XMD7_9BURK|nr:AlpA family phage regulatory protein [Pandoraea pneumonica]VVE37410.1 hypothetical protein PPN31114_03979 [Pandoraea pneumonica]
MSYSTSRGVRPPQLPTPTLCHAPGAGGASSDSCPPVIDPILLLPEVLTIVRIGRTTLYKMIKEGTFPAPLHLSSRIRGWRMSSVKAFLDSLESAA